MAEDIVLGKIIDEKRKKYEQNHRPVRMDSMTEEILWCVQQGLRSFNLIWTPWNIMIERKSNREFKVVAWFPTGQTLPNGYHYPTDAVAFWHVEDHPVDSFMDVNFWPIARELAKGMIKQYRGEG